MNKEQIYQYLSEHNCLYEVTEHKAVYNMEELDLIELPYPEQNAKNLFVRDDKKILYCLITVKDGKQVDLKEFRKAQGLRRLSFASADDLATILGLIPGAVTPLGLLNDEKRKVYFYLDSEFSDNLIGIHPNDNTATVFMQTNDLVRIIKEHGNNVEIIEI